MTITMEEDQILVSESGETLCWIRESISDKTATLSLGGYCLCVFG